MARPQTRKRRRADESSRDLPSKKRRQDDRDPDDYLVTWRYPPEFWDRLSRIPLIVDALDELEQRNNTRPSFPSPPTKLAPDLSPAAIKELTRFARYGGPDLCDLRGYPEPIGHQPACDMSSSRGRATASTDPTTVASASETTKSKRSITAYQPAFDQHLIDHSIHPLRKSRKPREDDRRNITEALAVPRPSLSPSKFSDGAFEEFENANLEAKDEEAVKANVIPTITGSRHANHPCARDTVFGNLDPLTDGSIARAKPDLYYGAHPEDLDRSIRDELSHHIVPSTTEDKPLAPNFFTELKGPDGSAAVMQRQARYDGAIGARGIHSLQNYGNDEPVYDGRPYTFSSTYHGGTGTLQLYTHYMTEPDTPGGRPEYHMTQVDAFAMTAKREAFVQGATAFRNARDLAKQYRDSFIRAANERARRPGEEAPAAADTSVVQQGEGSSPDEFVDCDEFLLTLDVHKEAPGPHPQQSFVGVDDHIPCQTIHKKPRFPQYLVDDDGDQQDDSQSPVPFDTFQGPEASVETSFTSSFASSFPSSSHLPARGHGSHSKRPRISRSPPLEPHIAEDHHKAGPARPSKKKTKNKAPSSGGAEGNDAGCEWNAGIVVARRSLSGSRSTSPTTGDLM
ncbi:hypothetical protein RB595_010087 [Gaeumannomyces hyphopodioides]